MSGIYWFCKGLGRKKSYISERNLQPLAKVILLFKTIVTLNRNKDHQRMMVDQMFMIVQNLRLFLTDVTPTAVAPTADQFGPYWTILNHDEPY